jgi:hypothetical protein
MIGELALISLPCRQLLNAAPYSLLDLWSPADVPRLAHE